MDSNKPVWFDGVDQATSDMMKLIKKLQNNKMSSLSDNPSHMLALTLLTSKVTWAAPQLLLQKLLDPEGSHPHVSYWTRDVPAHAASAAVQGMASGRSVKDC